MDVYCTIFLGHMRPISYGNPWHFFIQSNFSEKRFLQWQHKIISRKLGLSERRIFWYHSEHWRSTSTLKVFSARSVVWVQFYWFLKFSLKFDELCCFSYLYISLKKLFFYLKSEEEIMNVAPFDIYFYKQ